MTESSFVCHSCGTRMMLVAALEQWCPTCGTLCLELMTQNAVSRSTVTQFWYYPRRQSTLRTAAIGGIPLTAPGDPYRAGTLQPDPQQCRPSGVAERQQDSATSPTQIISTRDQNGLPIRDFVADSAQAAAAAPPGTPGPDQPAMAAAAAPLTAAGWAVQRVLTCLQGKDCAFDPAVSTPSESGFTTIKVAGINTVFEYDELVAGLIQGKLRVLVLAPTALLAELVVDRSRFAFRALNRLRVIHAATPEEELRGCAFDVCVDLTQGSFCPPELIATIRETMTQTPGGPLLVVCR